MTESQISLIELISNYFQCNFNITCNNVKYKEGKLILVKDKEFYIKLEYIDKKNNKNRILDIPMPFKFYMIDNCIYLDYTIKSICCNYDLEFDIKKINDNNNKHLFYNNVVKICFN